MINNGGMVWSIMEGWSRSQFISTYTVFGDESVHCVHLTTDGVGLGQLLMYGSEPRPQFIKGLLKLA